jgi:ABC-type methionine transport system ATPase subunit
VAAAAKRTSKAGGSRAAGKGAIVAKPMELNFPSTLVGKPVLYELVTRFDVVPNIKRANITQDFGYMQLELKGTAPKLAAALAYLKKAGVGVAPIEKDVVES